MRTAALFIGGPSDCRRMIFEGHAPGFIQVPVPSPSTCVYDPHQQGPDRTTITLVEYRRVTLQGPTGEFTVYHTGEGDVIEQLINGYKGQS